MRERRKTEQTGSFWISATDKKLGPSNYIGCPAHTAVLYWIANISISDIFQLEKKRLELTCRNGHQFSISSHHFPRRRVVYWAIDLNFAGRSRSFRRHERKPWWLLKSRWPGWRCLYRNGHLENKRKSGTHYKVYPFAKVNTAMEKENKRERKKSRDSAQLISGTIASVYSYFGRNSRKAVNELKKNWYDL